MTSIARIALSIMAPALALVLSGCTSLTASRVSVDYYQINGRTTAALDREIRRKGPRIGNGSHAVAVARIRMQPKIETRLRGGFCDIQNADVHVDARVTLPQWRGRANAEKELAQAWDNVERYTRLHEAVHVAIAFGYAEALEKEIEALAPATSCLQLRRQAQVIVDRFLREHDLAQKAFDAREQSRIAKAARGING